MYNLEGQGLEKILNLVKTLLTQLCGEVSEQEEQDQNTAVKLQGYQ